MPSVTFDGRSFMLDGRRIWIVSGALHYARVPRELWADRIHAARRAGLNTIETPVVWARHEPRPGQFDFTGDNDIRHFIQLIGQAGLHCILRPGPYVGAEWDMGGLPAWLLELEDVRLRTSNAPFLESSSRYITALADQVKDLQVTSPGEGGPILLVQNETAWTCGHDPNDRPYLGELDRYLREAGFSVPTISANNLWREVEGEIDCWSGSEDMLGVLRQLATVRPEHPRFVADLRIARPATWGGESDPPTAATAQRRVAEVLAAGGQFNIQPFFTGANFGFDGGRLTDSPFEFIGSEPYPQAPLRATGAPGHGWAELRRILTFSSRFARVLANLDSTYRPVMMSPDDLAARSKSKSSALAVAHCAGSQGSVVLVFGDDPGRGGGASTTLLMPDGTTLPISLGSQAVGWYLFDVHLRGRIHLDYCNINALALVGSVFVAFGQAGSVAQLSLNGSPLEIDIPKGKTPRIIEHEGMTLAILSEQQADVTCVNDDAIYVGVGDVRTDGTVIAASGYARYTRIAADGSTSTATNAHTVAAPRPQKPTMSNWAAAGTADYTSGQSARFAMIDGPAELAALGAPYGYGWYRVSFKMSSTKRVKLHFPQASDRLHMFLDGEPLGVIGAGAADDPLPLSIKKGPHELVLLVENLGRFSEGSNLGEPKGLFGHIYDYTPFKAGKASIVTEEPIDVLAFRSPLWEIHKGDATQPERLSWSFAHRRKSPVIMSIDAFVGRGVVVLNGEPMHYLDRGVHERLVFDSEMLTRGNNTIQIALLGDGDDVKADLQALAGATSFSEGAAPVSGKADWSFAKWEAPAPAAFEPVTKTAMSSMKGPTWWRCRFSASDTEAALFLDATGLTKGQIYLNGRHVGRYYVADERGKSVGSQSEYHLPTPWLNTDGDNELMFFDEHGGNPSKCRLHYDTTAMPLKS